MTTNLKSLEKEMKFNSFNIMYDPSLRDYHYVLTNVDESVKNTMLLDSKYNNLEQNENMIEFIKDSFKEEIKDLVLIKEDCIGYPLFGMTYKGIKYQLSVDEGYAIHLHEEVSNPCAYKGEKI